MKIGLFEVVVIILFLVALGVNIYHDFFYKRK